MQIKASYYCSVVLIKTLYISAPCPIKGQVRKPCASDSSCHRTCANQFIFFLPCPEVCIVNGCECPDGLLINEDNNECIAGSKCKPGKCDSSK